MQTKYSFDSFYRMFKKNGFWTSVEFVKANPEYKKMLTKAVAIDKIRFAA